jgi:hypothetical protein
VTTNRFKAADSTVLTRDRHTRHDGVTKL